MWQAIFRCRVVEQGCDPVAKMLDRHPAQVPVEPPLCTDHGEPMVMVSYHAVETGRPERHKPKRRPGGFHAQQMDLF